MIEALLVAASLLCVEPDPPTAREVATVLRTEHPSKSVYGTTAPYDFLTPTEPSEDGVLSYRVYVDPLYESYAPCFDEIVEGVLSDSRSWGNMRRAGPTESPQVWIILAPPGIARCGPDSWPYGSCARHGDGRGQIYINTGRWMVGWQPLASIKDSRVKLINHEVGHILGFGHMDCTVMGYYPIHPDVEGGHTEDVGWDTCPPPPWPVHLVADGQL